MPQITQTPPSRLASKRSFSFTFNPTPEEYGKWIARIIGLTQKRLGPKIRENPHYDVVDTATQVFHDVVVSINKTPPKNGSSLENCILYRAGKRILSIVRNAARRKETQIVRFPAGCSLDSDSWLDAVTCDSAHESNHHRHYASDIEAIVQNACARAKLGVRESRTVRLVLLEGYQITRAAVKAGVNASTLRDWIAKVRAAALKCGALET